MTIIALVIVFCSCFCHIILEICFQSEASGIIEDTTRLGH